MPIPFTLDIATQPQQKDIKWVAAGDWASFDDTVIGLAAGDVIEQAAFTVKVDPADGDLDLTSVQRLINDVDSVNGVITANRLLFYFQPDDTEKMVSAHYYDLQIWVRRGSALYVRTILRGRIYARQDITNSTTLIDPATTLTITNGASASGAPGSTLQLVAEVRDGQGDLHPEYNPLWSTSNAAVATVDPTGFVRFWTAGTCVISATLPAFGLADSINITVTGSSVLAAVTGDVMTYDGTAWNPANPDTRFVKRGGDTVAGAYIWQGAQTLQSTLAVTGTTTLTGNVGIGGASTVDVKLYLATASGLTGTTQFGLYTDITFSGASTSAAYGIWTSIKSAVAAYTIASASGIRVAAPTIGAGSAITSLRGLNISNQGAAGVTHAYGIYIDAQSGAATTNLGLYNAGTTQLMNGMGIGVAPAPNVLLYIHNPSTALTGVTQAGVYASVVFSSTGTSSIRSFYGIVRTEAAAWTATLSSVYYADSPVIGAGSAITNQNGLHVANQGAAGVTNAYGIYINAQSGAASTNIGLYNAGTTTLVGEVTVGAAAGSDVSLSLNATSVGNKIVATRYLSASSVKWLVAMDTTTYKFSIGKATAAYAFTEYFGIDFTAGATNLAGAVSLSSTLAVTGTSTLTGNVGIGGASSAAAGLYLRSAAMTGTTQYGAILQPTMSSAATSNGYGLQAGIITAAAAFTLTAGYSAYILSPSLGATSAITTQNGLYVANQGAAGITNAYGVYIAAQSGATTTNIGLYNGGTTQLTGVVSLGAAPIASRALNIGPITLTGIAQYGLLAAPTFSSAATAEGNAIYASVITAAASYTITNGAGMRIDTPTLGAASAITTLYGVFIANQGNAGVTNAYGLYIAAQSGAVSTNIGIYNSGTARLGTNVGINGNPTPTSQLNITGLPTSAAGLAAGDVWSNAGVLTIV